MSTTGSRRKRADRRAIVKLRQSGWLSRLAVFRRRDVALRLGAVVLAALAVWAGMRGWEPPFAYRRGDIPHRNIVARVEFEVPDPPSEQQRHLARLQARCVYRQNPEAIVQLRSELTNKVAVMVSATTLQELQKTNPTLWDEFSRPLSAAGQDEQQAEEEFEQFRAALGNEQPVTQFAQALEEILAPLEQHGLLKRLQHSDGNQREILVYRQGGSGSMEAVQVTEVLMAVQLADDGPLMQRLAAHRVTGMMAERLFYWLRDRLSETLVLDAARTAEVRQRDMDAVRGTLAQFAPGQLLAEAGRPLNDQQLRLLREEHQAVLRQQAGTPLAWRRGLGTLLLVLGWLAVCGGYVVSRHGEIVAAWKHLLVILALGALVVPAGRWLSHDTWRAEIIPLLLLGMTLAIAYRRELAMVLTLAAASLLVLALGRDVADFLIITGVCLTAIVGLGRIRSRLKIIQVSLLAAAAGVALTLVLGMISGSQSPEGLLDAAWRMGLWSVVSGFVITGLLPLIESGLNVLTDLSLLELGAPSHPLLQELVRKAPGTYNHSINVASLAEAAAEAIGARGLLVRVGAYFHDVGKTRMPAYFAENQTHNGNRHDALLPAMSTLVIIAHVKDGVELAREYHLPQPLIDFIEQHHGTTLVEYFYQRANEQSQADPTYPPVDEAAYRYPGPKPQTKEAAVLMLADAVESASRTLVEPTPSRLANLVERLASNRLMDGQFDESGLNLQELRIVEDTLIKSLTAMYHGRVRYPDQQTA
jgi:putative nucleotidyltransferase with HDIG domain